MEITGRVTADAKLTTTKKEQQVINFSIAITDQYRQKGSSELKKITTYVQCSYWLNPAMAEYLIKGTVVLLAGRIGVNAYINGAGEAKANLTFHVNSIKLFGGARATARQAEAPAGAILEPVDDLPF